MSSYFELLICLKFYLIFLFAFYTFGSKIDLSGIAILPNTYQIASKWLISEHDRRVNDGSLTFDYFNVSEGKIEYCISKCAYIEMFEQYGIRSLGKIFCMTDTTSYENLPKHVNFIRYSDLSDGSCCHDKIIDKRKIKDR